MKHVRTSIALTVSSAIRSPIPVRFTEMAA